MNAADVKGAFKSYWRDFLAGRGDIVPDTVPTGLLKRVERILM